MKNVIEFLKEHLGLTKLPRRMLLSIAVLFLSQLLAGGLLWLQGFFQIEKLVPTELLLKLGSLLPPVVLLLVCSYVSYVILLLGFNSQPSAKPVKTVTSLSFNKLDKTPEGILSALAHSDEPAYEKDIITFSKLSRPVVIHALESMKDLKYVGDHYDYEGRSWSCAKLGRAYLAHHKLI